jgi:hypothetical protein
MKLIAALEYLAILYTHRDQGREERRWRMPAEGTQDEYVVSELNRVLPLVLPLVLKAAKGYPHDPTLQLAFLLDNGPDFTNPMTVPGDHENCVARLYRFLSLVLWAFLRHIKIHPSLLEPRKVACFANTFIGRRKPDIVLLHRIHNQRTEPKWAHIASIGKNWIICGCV